MNALCSFNQKSHDYFCSNNFLNDMHTFSMEQLFLNDESEYSISQFYLEMPIFRFWLLLSKQVLLGSMKYLLKLEMLFFLLSEKWSQRG